MSQNKEVFSVTAEFIHMLKKHGQAQKNTETVNRCIDNYRGRRLSSILNPCGVAAALEVSGAPKDQVERKASHWGTLVHVLQKLSLPVDDYILESIVQELGNIVQVETLKLIVQHIEHIQKEVRDRTGEATTYYNVPVNVRDSQGNILLRTMNNLVIEGSDEVFVFLVRSGRSDITRIEKEFYISMLSNLQQYPDKQVTIGMILAINETQDMVIPSYWSASEELLHIPRAKAERDLWYDTKFRSFIYSAHKSFPKSLREDLTKTGKTVVGAHCSSCSYREFCGIYILKHEPKNGDANEKKIEERVSYS